MAVDNIGMDVPTTFGDSRPNGFRDIRGAYCVSIERTLAKHIPIARNGQGVSPKKVSPKKVKAVPKRAEVVE